MIKLENVNFSFFRGFSLKNINLQLPPGTYALIGSNGSGKSTLINCLVGNYEYRGKITVQGKGRIGFLPQRAEFFKDLTVWEMLAYLYCVKGLGKKIDKAEIQRCMEATNLLEQKDKKVKELSGGMLRRLGVAQAILGDPELLVFDEPTAGLDPEERMRFKNMIYRMDRTNDKVVIISTHITDDISGRCDKLIVLKDGEVVAFVTEDELKAFAVGKVYQVPADMQNDTQLYVERDVKLEGQEYIRVLSSSSIPGYDPVVPTLEDGYLCLIKNI